MTEQERRVLRALIDERRRALALPDGRTVDEAVAVEKTRAEKRERYRRNPRPQIDRALAYYYANRERVLARKKAAYAADPERVLAPKRRRYHEARTA